MVLRKRQSVQAEPSSCGLSDSMVGMLWDKSDYFYMQKLFRKIHFFKVTNKMEEKQKAIAEFEWLVDRNYNDQSTPIQAQEMSFAEDRVTTDGLGQMALLICNESRVHFDYGASGAGTTAARITDLILEYETARVDIAGGAGYQSASGTSIKHNSIFSQNFPSADITEYGAFTEPDANSGAMLFRSVFPQGRAIHHIVNNTFYTINHSIILQSLV